MTFREVATPIEIDFPQPTQRAGGLSHNDLIEACLRPEGIGPALQNLEQEDVLVVTTGQQPGLFTGPLYTIYKALSAAALAHSLERRWQRPVVPVFWLAGDDHDFAEANHASWLGSDGTLNSWVLREHDDDAPLTPMYREALGQEIVQGLDVLEQSLPPSDFLTETMSWLRAAYHPEASVASSFGEAMAELLAPYGVVCFDSTHAVVKRHAAPVLMKAVGLSQDLDRDLDRRATDLIDAGMDPKVHVGDGATLVMLESSTGRDRLIVDGTELLTRRGHERFSLDQLQALAAEDPQRFSPNVLLRPVLESALLPTVAYVAGPGELRYLRLTDPIYQRLRIHQQTPMPRWSGVVVERRVDRVLDKFSASLQQLVEPDQALERSVVRSHMPTEVIDAVATLRTQIEQGYDTLATFGADIDPTMAKPVEGSRKQALGAVEHIEKRLQGHLKRRETTELEQIGRAREAVWPNGKPQERVLTLATYRARYGDAFIATMATTIQDWYEAALEGKLVPS